jgi:hypothetical protein
LPTWQLVGWPGNALPLGAARQVNEPAAVATVPSELKARPLYGEQRLLLRSIGYFPDADAQSGAHLITLPISAL